MRYRKGQQRQRQGHRRCGVWHPGRGRPSCHRPRHMLSTSTGKSSNWQRTSSGTACRTRRPGGVMTRHPESLGRTWIWAAPRTLRVCPAPLRPQWEAAISLGQRRGFCDCHPPRWQEYQQWQQYQAYQYWAATGMAPTLPYAPAPVYDLQHWPGVHAPCAATPAAAYGEAPSSALSAPAMLQPLRGGAKPRQKHLSTQNVGAAPQRPGSSGMECGCGHGAHAPRRSAAGSVADRFAQQESDRQQGHLQQLDQRHQQQLRVARRPDG